MLPEDLPESAEQDRIRFVAAQSVPVVKRRDHHDLLLNRAVFQSRTTIFAFARDP